MHNEPYIGIYMNKSGHRTVPFVHIVEVIPIEWIYEKSKDNTSRFILGTIGVKPLVCFGINPSTAEPENLDNTLKSVTRLALNNGFDSWIMLNVYPQRATNPNELHNEVCLDLHQKNLIVIEQIFKNYNPKIWAAWGTLILKREYLSNCLSSIIELSQKYECSWMTIGKESKNGHPHHPLYLRQTEVLKEFDVHKYMSLIS